MLHASCVVGALARSVALTPLRWPAVNFGAQHLVRDALEAAYQADPCLRNWPARMGGGPQAKRTYAAGGFGTDGTKTAWV